MCIHLSFVSPDPSSAKYPWLQFLSCWRYCCQAWELGYDVACSFSTTLMNSSLSMKAHNLGLCLVMPAFHGHAHNHFCQLSFHMSSGSGLEDLETCESLLDIMLFPSSPGMQSPSIGGCEGDTMTRPLLISEILQKGELIGYEHMKRLVQWLSSVYNE